MKKATAHSWILLDSTTAYTPEENANAERTNRTIMFRVRATLSVSNIPFYKYWALFGLDTNIKMNSFLQRTISEIILRLWERHHKPFSLFFCRSFNLYQYRIFGKYRLISHPQNPKTKSVSRGVLVWYLYALNDAHYKDINLTTGQFHTFFVQNLRPYNPQFDPSILYSHTIPATKHLKHRVNLHYVHPRWSSAAAKAPHKSNLPQ